MKSRVKPISNMAAKKRFTKVQFKNYKALSNYSVSLRQFNILVGPNNSGKSTILGAFRILSEGIRRARARKPEPFRQNGGTAWGYKIPLDDLPISTENVFANYNDSIPATIEFSLSDGNRLELYFPEVGLCYLICHATRPIQSPAGFKREFPTTVGFVPVLGPVEHNEPLYKVEAARKALLAHGASRNFRNIWYHFSEDFDEFRGLIRSTWPGMDVEKPTVNYGDGKPTLTMFCPEERYPREIYWAGFGFQVWCQMLTYMLRARNDSLLIIDEPDIYLHSDLQRQLLNLLENLGPDILMRNAFHRNNH
jgi:energy-coupling factor transporter ATP-binding protein EcfA2